MHGRGPRSRRNWRRGLNPCYHRGYRITDADTLDCVLDAGGQRLSRSRSPAFPGLPNTPMANSQIRVIGGNFVTAHPIGVLDGIDLNTPARCARDGTEAQLGIGNIVLLCQGASPTGEIFNLQMEEVAEAVAIALKADKLVFHRQPRRHRRRWRIPGRPHRRCGRTSQGRAPAVHRPQALSALCRAASRQGWGGASDWLKRTAPCCRRYSPTTASAPWHGSPWRPSEARPDDIGALIALIEPMEEEGIRCTGRGSYWTGKSTASR